MECLADAPRAGVGLKPQHFDAAAVAPAGVWYEVHTENYFVEGGERLDGLCEIAERFPISLHGVGASLGGPDPVDGEHLRKVRRLVAMLQPAMVSEHAVWSRAFGAYFAELLPLPRTTAAMQRLSDGVARYQDAVGRRIHIENPTNYLNFISEMDEPGFLLEVARRSGCGLLLDVNNLHLSARNCGMDPISYIDALPADLVGEIHIAGFDEDPNIQGLLIDSHAAPVSDDVWNLLGYALRRLGPKPVLLERDANLPAFDELMRERKIADELLQTLAYGAQDAIA